MSALDFVARLEGMPEPTLADLDAHLPHLERLAAALKQAEPIINQLIPIFNKAYPDFVAVTPLIQELIAFAKQKETET